MADVIDRAQRSEAMFMRQALERRKREHPDAQSAHECADCGEPIPEARRRAIPGCQRCMACQAGHDGER